MSTQRRTGPITAGALLAELEADPEWVAARAARAAESASRAEQRRQALAPVTLELRAAGFDVDSPWQLHQHAPYPAAIPILMKHLRLQTYDEEARTDIARALGVREARCAWRDLVDLYRNTDPGQDNLMQALAAALFTTADRAVADELVDMLFDARLGTSRVLLLGALTRLRLPNAWPLITRALTDADLAKEAAHMLHQRELRAAQKRRKA